MNGFQPLLTSVPWVPVIGNHEYYEGDMFNRFLNMSQGVIMNGAVHHNPDTGRGAPALNGFLTASVVYGRAAKHQHHPQVNGAHSSTSRYYSEDLGLIHFAALDFSPYYFASTERQHKAPQLEWLEADLKSVDRSKTPWVVVMGHFPLYCSSVTLSAKNHADMDPLGAEVGTFEGCTGTGEGTVEQARNDIEPLMLKYGVDLFFAGHEHDYESIWPVAGGKKVAETFDNPPAPVHFVTGAGGPPGLDRFGDSGPWDRKRLSDYGYGRLTAHDAKSITFQQVVNSDGSIFDEVTITKDNHQPYTETLRRFFPLYASAEIV